jgi:hypothetical protein
MDAGDPIEHKYPANLPSSPSVAVPLPPSRAPVNVFLRIPCYVLLFFSTVLQKISPLCTRSPTQLARCSPLRLTINQSRMSNEMNITRNTLVLGGGVEPGPSVLPPSSPYRPVLNAQRIFSMDADDPAGTQHGLLVLGWNRTRNE